MNLIETLYNLKCSKMFTADEVGCIERMSRKTFLDFLCQVSKIYRLAGNKFLKEVKRTKENKTIYGCVKYMANKGDFEKYSKVFLNQESVDEDIVIEIIGLIASYEESSGTSL